MASTLSPLALVTFLQGELQAILAESKRKQTDLREAIGHAQSLLKDATELSKPWSLIAGGLDKSDLRSILLPFLLAAQAKNPRMLALSINVVTRLIINGILTEVKRRLLRVLGLLGIGLVHHGRGSVGQ